MASGTAYLHLQRERQHSDLHTDQSARSLSDIYRNPYHGSQRQQRLCARRQLHMVLHHSQYESNDGPESAGWFSGDIHVHRSCGGSPEALSTFVSKMTPAESVAVISLLAD